MVWCVCMCVRARARARVRVVFMLIDYIYILLFSALDQTHCALVACDSK